MGGADRFKRPPPTVKKINGLIVYFLRSKVSFLLIAMQR